LTVIIRTNIFEQEDMKMRLVLNIETEQVALAAKRAKINRKEYIEILKAEAAGAIQKKINTESDVIKSLRMVNKPVVEDDDDLNIGKYLEKKYK